jgi:hypothetical protein
VGKLEGVEEEYMCNLTLVNEVYAGGLSKGLISSMVVGGLLTVMWRAEQYSRAEP